MSPRTPGRVASAETIHMVERSADQLTTAAYRHMEEHLDWYPKLTARERSWVGVVVQSGFASFVRWYVDPAGEDIPGTGVFADPPRALTRTITLRQTLDLLRTVVDVVEEHIPELAAPEEQAALRVAVLRYSRDSAFAAAQAYAGAAEIRGAWDARLEALVVDAVLRGEHDEDLMSRAAALGWDERGAVTVIVGDAPRGRSDRLLDRARTAAGKAGLEVLLAVQERRLVVVLGGAPDALAAAARLAPAFGKGPLVVGPTVPRLHAAGRSARAALSGGAPRPDGGKPRARSSPTICSRSASWPGTGRPGGTWRLASSRPCSRQAGRCGTRRTPSSPRAAASRPPRAPCSYIPTP